MALVTSPENYAKGLLPLLRLLIGSDIPARLGDIWQLGRKVFAARAHEGMYEVLEYESVLELQDTKGKKAVLRKRERVKFTQNNIIAFQDLALGDGELFAEYQCSPGKSVDRYRDGHRYRILISLQETKRRGDVQEFRIERTIANGFTDKVEYFQTEVDHRTKELLVRIIFPQRRFPKQVVLVEQNLQRTTPLGPEHLFLLPDGRQQLSWCTMKPRVFETYILKWEW